jgi:hypothetical protein
VAPATDAVFRRVTTTPYSVVVRPGRLPDSLLMTGVRHDAAAAGADGQTATSFNAP